MVVQRTIIPWVCSWRICFRGEDRGYLYVQLYICYEKEIVLRKLWISDGLTGELTDDRYLHIQLLL
jgi:hypothetical protein